MRSVAEVGSIYPAMRWRDLYQLLSREPLNYVTVRQKGSHRTLEAEGRPSLLLAGHESDTCPPGLVRKVLTKDVGLTDEEAKRLL